MVVVHEALHQIHEKTIAREGLTTGHQYVILLPCGLFVFPSDREFYGTALGAEVGIPGVAGRLEIRSWLTHVVPPFLNCRKV